MIRLAIENLHKTETKRDSQMKISVIIQNIQSEKKDSHVQKEYKEQGLILVTACTLHLKGDVGTLKIPDVYVLPERHFS